MPFDSMQLVKDSFPLSFKLLLPLNKFATFEFPI